VHRWDICIVPAKAQWVARGDDGETAIKPRRMGKKKGGKRVDDPPLGVSLYHAATGFAEYLQSRKVGGKERGERWEARELNEIFPTRATLAGLTRGVR